MLRPVVDHVAPLAEGREVEVAVVSGVVIPMGGEDDPGPASMAEDVGIQSYADPPSPVVAPTAAIRVPPAAVAAV